MAKTTTLTYAVGLTINTGNFNSCRLDQSETVELEPGDDPVAVSTDLRNRVVARIQADASTVQRSA